MAGRRCRVHWGIRYDRQSFNLAADQAGTIVAAVGAALEYSSAGD